MKAKRKKPTSSNNNINLKNVLQIPSHAGANVPQTINLKQEYFLPIYNNSPHETTTKLIFHKPKINILTGNRKREKGSKDLSNSSAADNSRISSSNKQNMNVIRTEQGNLKLIKKKSYSFNRLPLSKE